MDILQLELIMKLSDLHKKDMAASKRRLQKIAMLVSTAMGVIEKAEISGEVSDDDMNLYLSAMFGIGSE